MPIVIVMMGPKEAFFNMSSLNVLSGLFLVIYAFYACHRQLPYARPFAFALTTFVFPVGLGVLGAYNVFFNAGTTFIYAFEFATCYLSVMFSLILVQRINTYRGDKEKSDTDARVANETANAKSEFLAAMSHEIRTPH